MEDTLMLLRRVLESNLELAANVRALEKLVDRRAKFGVRVPVASLEGLDSDLEAAEMKLENHASDLRMSALVNVARARGRIRGLLDTVLPAVEEMPPAVVA